MHSARGGPGPSCVGKCIVRAAAPAHSARGKMPCARGQGRRARGDPGPFCMRRHWPIPELQRHEFLMAHHVS
eukprot:9218749-Pyramimonas_sp.AAC.1